MQVINVSADTDRLRELFLRQLFGDHTGYVCIAYATKARKDFREEFFMWPKESDKVLKLVNDVYQGHNVWICPHLFFERKRKKETVKLTPNSWSDLDTCDPKDLLVEPTLLVESSPGRWQAYWSYEKPVDSDDAENISQRIAYKHADEGADRSGWDLTQLLRMPMTYNYKYATTPIVTVIEANRKRYRLQDFAEHYPQVEGFSYLDIDMPAATDLPDHEELLAHYKYKVNPLVWRLYGETPTGSWSEPLWQLQMMLFEAGLSREEVFSISRFAACNKYDRDGTNIRMLWKEVCRASARHEANTHALMPKDYIENPLITNEERASIEGDDTFIERYITWAKSLGDAAPQYHQAGAFIVLSSLLAGNVQLPTSFGVVKPNLWFMILADTTLTRKSTAMDIAMDLVMEIDDDVLMATDGSIEGLLTSLSTRPGKPSVFLRDEFSGLLEMITKKDYYAGMPEFLTKLYDGKMQKRILRKESIEVRDPCLIVFAGGIKNKITSLLSFEHVSSGFMPRFVFITAESDITRVRPLGPPTDWTDSNRSAILDEIADLAAHYKTDIEMTVKDSKVSWSVPRKFDAKLSPEAWFRYNTLEQQLLDSGIHSTRPEIMTPVGDRLAKSILKAAVLLAASRQRSETLSVEVEDIIRAAAYGESWRMYGREVMESVGKGGLERRLDQILAAVNREPGIPRSKIMQTYHLTAREMNMMIETLEQRALITRERRGRGEILHPNIISITPKQKAASS